MILKMKSLFEKTRDYRIKKLKNKENFKISNRRIRESSEEPSSQEVQESSSEELSSEEEERKDNNELYTGFIERRTNLVANERIVRSH